jgi:hypothetical protein
MEPLTVLTVVVKYLYRAAEKVQHNGEECRRLANHTQAVLTLIQSEFDGEVPPTLLVNLQHLTWYAEVEMLFDFRSFAHSTLQDLNSTLDSLSNQAMLKKILWRGRVEKKITVADRRLAETIQLFQVSLKYMFPNKSQYRPLNLVRNKARLASLRSRTSTSTRHRYRANDSEAPWASTFRTSDS